MTTKIASLLFFLFGSLSLYAAEITIPQITVHGTAVKKVTPDTMNWYLTIQNKGKNLSAVAKDHTKNVQAVIAILKNLKVPEDKLQTANMRFGENWTYRNNSSVKDGYLATTNIQFDITDFTKYNTLWMELSKNNSVSINGVYYDHSKRIEFQNETRKEALLIAKEKAKALAETLGSNIGEPLLIEEDAPGRNSPHLTNRIEFKTNSYEPSGSGIAPSQISIKMHVNATFRLVSAKK